MRVYLSQSLLFLVLLPALIGACGRSELFRIRLLAPVTEKQQDFTLLTNKQSTTASKETLKVPVTSGGSLYLVFGTLGFGNTSLVTKIEKETRSKTNDTLVLRETTTITGRFNDLAFVLGENYTLMWGFGALGEEACRPRPSTATAVLRTRRWKAVSSKETPASLSSDITVVASKPCWGCA